MEPAAIAAWSREVAYNLSTDLPRSHLPETGCVTCVVDTVGRIVVGSSRCCYWSTCVHLMISQMAATVLVLH